MITTLKRRPATGMSSCMMSSIQQKIAVDNFMTGYKDQIRNLLEKYDTYSLLIGARQNGSLMEITEGIFEEKMITDSLDEALKNLQYGESIWIRGREKSGERKYLVGRTTSTITECAQDRNVWDIKHQKLINEAN